MTKPQHGRLRIARTPKILKPPAGEVYTHIESARGARGGHLVSDGGPNPYRFRMRAPSFVHLQALPHMMRGWKVADSVAILGSIGTAIYRRAMAGSVIDGIPREAAAAARDTLGGAVAVARELPGLGDALLDMARKAFTHGLQVTALTSALVAMAMAIIAMVSLRHVPERR